MKKIGAAGYCYAAVTILGTLFALTACAYGAMYVRATRGIVESTALMRLMDERGPSLMVGELVALGLATVGAIVVDSRQTRREMMNQASKRSDGRQ